MTSLSIQYSSDCILPDGWTEFLPQNLTSLTISPIACLDPKCPSYSFESLPKRLQHLNLTDCTCSDAGKEDLRRFTDLRILTLFRAGNLGVLDSLPPSLEELTLHDPTHLSESAIFALSKLPPKIRVLDLSDDRLALNFDCKAPDTLEEMRLEGSNLTLDTIELEKFFSTEKLRVLHVPGLSTSLDAKAILNMLPNLEDVQIPEIISYYGNTIDIDKFSFSDGIYLPKLKDLALFSSSDAIIPLKKLPPHLKQLFVQGKCSPEELCEIPRSISSLELSMIDGPLPSSVWRSLPKGLTFLDVPLRAFESEECMHVLPETIEDLNLDIAECEWLPELLFPKSMQNNLTSLLIAGYTGSLPFMLGTVNENFIRLSSLYLSGGSLINSDSLSHLPKSLSALSVGHIKLVNFGLPSGKTPENENDWNESAFSRLSEDLMSFQVHFAYDAADTVDLRIFSRLPKRLARLSVNGHSIERDDWDAWTSYLPRRLSVLEFKTTGDNADEENQKIEKAIKAYYASDPFWSDFKGI